MASCVEMHGSAGYSDVNDHEYDGLKEVFNYLKLQATNGVVINGILTWIDIQQKTTPPSIWLAQAASAFCDDEVEIAKATLWKASSNRLDIIGDIVGHRNPDRIEKNLKDINKAMKALKEANALPLLLSSSAMVRVLPAFHCDKNTLDLTDVMDKVKVVEESLSSFMKQNKDQMQKLTSSIANINRPISVITPAPADLINLADTPRTLTPGSKKRKLENENEVQSLQGITLISGAPTQHRALFREVVTRNMTAPQTSNQQPPRIIPPTRPPDRDTSQGSRPRRNSTLVYGNAKSGGSEAAHLELSADVSFVASGVSRDATPEQLGNFLVSKGIQVTEVELLLTSFSNPSWLMQVQ